jgi:hypothetical protein
MRWCQQILAWIHAISPYRENHRNFPPHGREIVRRLLIYFPMNKTNWSQKQIYPYILITWPSMPSLAQHVPRSTCSKKEYTPTFLSSACTQSLALGYRLVIVMTMTTRPWHICKLYFDKIVGSSMFDSCVSMPWWYMMYFLGMYFFMYIVV